MTYQIKAAAMVKKGKFKRAVKLMTKSIRLDPENQNLYHLRFEYGQFIPFDELYHQATEEYFGFLLNREVSGDIIHEYYSVYLSTTQGRIAISDDLLLKLAAIFAGYGFENDAVYIINRVIRQEVKPLLLVDPLVSLVNYYIDNRQKSKATQYVQYMIDFYPSHLMTRYIVGVYKRSK